MTVLMGLIETLWLPAAALVALAAFAVVLTYAPALLLRGAERRGLRRRCRGCLVLTYDDGPGPELTPPLLELLRRHGVRASFYLVGFRARQWPEVCDEIVAAGHEIGTHTDQHLNAWFVAPWRGAAEVNAGFERLGRWLRPGALFRPPFGKITTWSWLAARRRAPQIAWWTIDSGDATRVLPDAESIVRRAVDNGGGVVLMHSHDRGDDRAQYVLDVTERLIQAARDADLRLCTYEELLQGGVA